MASPLVCTLLFRWILPVFLLAASCLRFNGFSFIYLCCLLAVPLLPNPSRRYCAAGGKTGSFQKAVLALSSIVLFAQVVFQIVLGALHPYGHFLPNCSFYEQLSREIGLNRFDHVDALNIFRLIIPDIIIFVTSLTCVLCSRGLIDSSPLRTESQQNLISQSESSTWQNLAPYIVALMLLFAGIISPSVTCSVYFLAFLVFGTLWACHRVIRLKDQKAYAYVRIALMIYSMLHLAVLYLYQFQFFQNVVPPYTLVSRLVGLIGIIHTQCGKPYVLLVWHNLDWPDCIAPGVILLLYWILATETRFYFVKDEREEGHSEVRWWDLSRSSQRGTASETQVTEKNLQNLMRGSRGQRRTYNTIDSEGETIVHEEPIETIREPEDYSAVQGTLGSIMMFLMRQSYIASLIIMMAWSITYHSWLTFVLLLWACLIWITPFARWFCMVSSPGLVFYAECLLIIQYIYGLRLNDTELPKHDSTGTLDYSELGLKKWKFPFLHLGAQTLFTWVFWMTLRQHIREKEMKKRERQSNRGIPLTSFAHPLVQALRKMSSMDRARGLSAGTEMEMDALESWASDDAKALMIWIKSVFAKYWILLCCGAFLLVSLQNEVSVYQIGYMAIFLFILMCYQISITTWRLILRPLWWAMVIYSICILLMIYTYQFDNMPMYWHNATGLSDQWLYNLGLRQHTKASLLLELLTPTAFSIIIVIQLHFFHRPFMAMIDVRAARIDASAQERSGYRTINGICESGPSRDAIMQQPQSSTAEDGMHPVGDERPVTGGERADHSNRSLLIVVLVKIAHWYNVISKLLWRMGELHTNKLVNLILICVVVYQVCAINAVIIILLGISMPSRMLQKALSYCFLIWSSLVILSKMVYQLRFVQEDLFQHNCTDQSLPRPLKINHFTNNALWVGFYKTDIISADIKGYLLIVLAIVANAVIKHHQKLYRIRTGQKDPEPGVLFSGITRRMADEDLVLCFKYLCNKFFFHYGWEVCMVMIVITMAVRCDVTSVIYALWLGVFLVLGRQGCSIVWPVYVGFLAILLPIQYLLVLGWPPGLCLPYPWKSVMDSNLVHWFYLTDVVHPQNSKLLVVDFFQLLFACCQENVFASERYRRISDEVTAASSRSSRRSSRSRNTTPDFMWNITWLDFVKTIAFQHMYWLTLAIVYITVQSTESIFNFGFILWCFFFLWHGQALYLQPRKKLLRLWKIFIGYSYFTLLAKVCLQLVACVWVEYVKKHTGCWALQLLSMYCLREENYKTTTGNSSGGKECVAPDDTGLAMDCLCFTFLLIQLRIFSSEYFRHVVRDHREQSDMANRGAVIVNEHLRKELDQMRREDKSKMDRIRKSVSRLKDRQSKLIGQKVDPQSHYEAIYSGDYYLFESETESESESESSTSTPRRTPEPSEGMSGEEQLRGNGSSGGASRQNSRSSAEDEFVSVPQDIGRIRSSEQEKQTEAEGLASKIKGWCSWIYYYFAMAVDKIIDILNGISKDYREITEQLRKERKEKRKEKIRRWKLGYAGVRASQRFSEAATGSDTDMVDNKSITSRVVEDDYDSWSVLTVDFDETDCSDWRHTQMRLARFTVALFYALLAHTDIICYMLMILNHMGYASMLSMPLPFLVFLWGMLSIPRPTKNFWIATITYVQIVIVIKYVFKFPFIKFNECNYDGLKEKQSPLCAPRLIGIERDAHTSAYDLLLLLALYFHRAFLKVHGLWRDKAYGEEGEENDEIPTTPTTPMKEEQTAAFGQEQAQSTATVTPAEQDPEIGLPEERMDGERRKSERISYLLLLERLRDVLYETHVQHYGRELQSSFFAPVVAFIKRMIDPEVGAGAVDVYAPMFACQFIIFLIILFSWSAFSSPEPPAEANFAQIIEENVVPKTFLYMLLTQFFLIIIDRSLYLRKFVLGKLVYLVSLVILFHIFMFFVVPYVTQKPFYMNVPAIFMYIFQCTYFGLSAYQVRCGYPTRILGNFLTKSFTLTSGVLFQGFQAIPFLLELRSVMDWVCTDTTLTLLHWLKMEDIYANIYVLKCYRESEKTWPHNRGQKYPMLSKWGVGGILVLLLVLVIWFPLLLMSYINSVYISNLPTDATFSLTIGGYQPLFKVSAQEQFLKTLTDKQIDSIKDVSGLDTTGLYSKSQIEAFLQGYRGHGTVVRVKITGNSSSIWTISPPSRRFLMKELLSQESNITIRFKYEFTREPKTALVQETISGQKVILMEPGTEVRRNLAEMLNGTFSDSEIVIPGLFPTFVRVPASGTATPITVLYNASYVTCGLKLRVGSVPGFTGKVEWWELTQIKPPPIFDPQESVLEMITFNNLVPPLHFSFFASTGIIGLYVGFVWLVGKFVRLFFTSISYRIMFDEMPNVDKVLRLCLDIFMVRECKEFQLEEDLFAKLMFLYRSPETLIKWTKYKRH